MNHKDHVNLLQKGITEKGRIWADLGSGTGAFTLALADLIGPTGQIYTIDKDQRSLKDQEKAMRTNFPTTAVEYRAAALPDDSTFQSLMVSSCQLSPLRAPQRPCLTIDP